MTAVAVLGLGAMGGRMARRLLDAGHHVTGWNRSPAKTQALVDLGAQPAANPAEAVRHADVVITMVSDAAALRAVTEGPSGVAAAIRRRATLVEMSTVGPAALRRLAAALPPSIDLIDAPALALGTRLGLAQDVLYQVLAETPLARQAKRRRPAIEDGVYPARFALSLARKDADLLIETATANNVDARTGRAAARWLADAEKAGCGGLDYTAVLGHILDADSSPPAGHAEACATSVKSAPHYRWGEGCDGWWLADGQDMSVIEERVPPGRAETWHVHDRARQFFYVLAGEATIRLRTHEVLLQAGSGIQVAPGAAHQLVNRSPAPLRFLVISCPATRGDRLSVAHDDHPHPTQSPATPPGQ